MYNSDFTDLLDLVSPDINASMRNLGLVSIMNGYYEKKNDTYMVGYRYNGKEFPIVILLKYHFPWKFWMNNGFPMNSNEVSEKGENIGGRLVFNKIFNFELSVEPFTFNANDLNGFRVEPNEFQNIPTENFTLDLSGKKTFTKFTKKDTKDILKWLDKATESMKKKLEAPISQQSNRRFEELYKADEKVALKYAADEIKDIFLF